MEKFDIEKYNKNPNRPIIDEEGHPVKVLCTDLRERFDRGRYTILGLVKRIDENGVPYDSVEIYTWRGEPCLCDSRQLYFSPSKKICWVCLFRDKDFPDIPRAEVANSETQMLAYKALPDFIGYKTFEWDE